MSHRNIRILLIAVAASALCFARADHNPYARHIARAANEIQHHALYRVSGRRLLDGAIAGMVDVLHRAGDRHSSYVPAEAAAELMAEMQQSFGGVGIVISLRGDPPKLTIVAQPEPGTPAAKHDLRPGDVIQAIDEELTLGLTMGDILKRMRGPIGAPVELTIVHRDEQESTQVTIRRAVIETDTVKGCFKDGDARWIFRLPQDDRFAHVRLTGFADRSLEELEQTLENLQRGGVDGVVLDLRENAGGELTTAVAISNLFLDEGDAIVSIKDRFNQTQRSFSATEDGPFRSLPLVVLIDRNSASASEILAACLQDNERARVVGERSFGKGTVQHLIDIGPPIELHGEKHAPVLKLTSAKYWRPSEKDIHRQGLKYDPQSEADWGVRPEPGLEVVLTNDEYAAYRRNRMAQDTYNPNGDALPPVEGEPAKPFVDQALELAIGLLQDE